MAAAAAPLARPEPLTAAALLDEEAPLLLLPLLLPLLRPPPARLDTSMPRLKGKRRSLLPLLLLPFRCAAASACASSSQLLSLLDDPFEADTEP